MLSAAGLRFEARPFLLGSNGHLERPKGSTGTLRTGFLSDGHLNSLSSGSTWTLTHVQGRAWP